jgi:hypothetical protein
MRLIELTLLTGLSAIGYSGRGQDAIKGEKSTKKDEPKKE